MIDTTGFFINVPIEFEKLCLVYPPKVKEVLGNQNFGVYEKILTMSQEEIEDEYVKNNMDVTNMLNPLEYLLNGAYHDKNFYKTAQDAFLMFIHEPVTFLFEQKQILIGEVKKLSINNLRLITENNYFDFQNLVRQAIGRKMVEKPNPHEDPRVKRIKAKARYRDKIKAQKGNGVKLKVVLASICFMNIGISPLNIGELSYAAIPLLTEMYQEKEKFDLDIRSLLAGADSKKIKPKHWIRNYDD